jgi:hypothetical protein
MKRKQLDRRSVAKLQDAVYEILDQFERNTTVRPSVILFFGSDHDFRMIAKHARLVERARREVEPPA